MRTLGPRGVRGVLTKIAKLVLWLLLLCAVRTPAADNTQDPVAVLAQILAQKGTITSAELTQVEAAIGAQRAMVLASILRDKGILDANDLAKISPSSKPGTASQVLAQGPSSATPTSAATTTVAPSSPNAPPAPKQAEPQAKAELNTGKRVPATLYGTILFNAGFNGAGLNLEDAGTLVLKSGSGNTATAQSFYGAARQSRIGVRLNETQVAGASLTGAFEMDAYSASAPFSNGVNMGLFRLRLAYGRLDWEDFAIEVGQDFSIFAPLNPTSLALYAVPEFNGSGNPWARVPQIRIEAKQTLDSVNRLLYQIAVSDPDDGDFSSTFTGARPPAAGELGRMPAIESRIAWSVSNNNRDYMLGFSGRYGRGRNIGTVNDHRIVQSVDSWGAAVDYSLPLASIFNLTGEAYIGRALGIYQVATGEAVGEFGSAGGHGVLSRGGWMQIQFNLNRQCQFNAGYGIDNPSAHDVPVGSRYRNQNVFGNFIYKLSSNINVSLEYRRLLTYYRHQADQTGRANQFTLTAAYLF